MVTKFCNHHHHHFEILLLLLILLLYRRIFPQMVLCFFLNRIIFQVVQISLFSIKQYKNRNNKQKNKHNTRIWKIFTIMKE